MNQFFLTHHTIFGCCSSFNKEISLIAVEGTPSSSDSKRIFFRATNRPDFLFLPLYTTPYVPNHEKKNTTADKTQSNYSFHIAVNGYMEITEFLCPVPRPSTGHCTCITFFLMYWVTRFDNYFPTYLCVYFNLLWMVIIIIKIYSIHSFLGKI